MSSRGKKDCPNCNTEIGARCLLCSNCGYHFPTGEIRKDLLKEKKDTKVGPKIYKKLGKGKKKCPGCNIIIGGVSKKCPQCSFDFIAAKKIEKKKKVVKKETKEDYIDPRVKKLLDIPVYVAPKKLSSKDHAERILSYGIERAKSLLFMAKIGKCWSHVNWDIVEKGLV